MSIRSRKVDVVVVYKVDRLTRSLADFAKLVELFEAHGVSFVAVTQQFNTTTSMGRLTLNVLLSFAQFERELAGERIRDKFAASRRKGMWMGGTIPLGYDVKNRKLVINEQEADRVRLVFRQYLAVGCLAKLRIDLEQRGMRSKQRILISGRAQGGGSFGRGALYHLLQNRIYRGEAVHKGVAYPGEHKAIVDEELWREVQDRLAANRTIRRKSRIETGALLGGLIHDDRGNIMSPTYSIRRGNRYRYYISSALRMTADLMRARSPASMPTMSSGWWSRSWAGSCPDPSSWPTALRLGGVPRRAHWCATPSSGWSFNPARFKSPGGQPQHPRPATPVASENSIRRGSGHDRIRT